MFGNNENDSKNPNWTNKNWLKSRFHFSFAEYMNPRNMGFGVVRVFNDDLVQPSRGKTVAKYFFYRCFFVFHYEQCLAYNLAGFGEHPHRDAEICTYVVRGHLTHKDSMGTEETIHKGAIQFMVGAFASLVDAAAALLP
jgi:quercetin 2,3-dioxygenase